MSTKQQTSKEYFKTLQIIYYALITGPVIFGIALIFLYRMGRLNFGQQDSRDLFLYIVPLFVIGVIIGSDILFKNLLKATKNKKSLFEKMANYRSALMVKYSLLEGTSFFALVVYYITGDVLFLGMAGSIMVVFATIIPTIERAAKDLELNPDDKMAIYDPNRMIAEIEIMN